MINSLYRKFGGKMFVAQKHSSGGRVEFSVIIVLLA